MFKKLNFEAKQGAPYFLLVDMSVPTLKVFLKNLKEPLLR